MQTTINWPPIAPTTPLAVLASGGLDSAILLAEAVRVYPKVHPLYIRTGLYWETTELVYLDRFLAAIATTNLLPLSILEQPVRDLYGNHWSLTGLDIPIAGTPDEDVYLPGRNVLLLAKSLLWCYLNGVPEIAMAPLAANPFPDATNEFFAEFSGAVNRAVQANVRILRPYSHLHKSEILKRANGIPLRNTFSCIRPVDGLHCGRCNKCFERQQGFRDADLADPTTYSSRHV
ncbi:MAG TPA: 7-cyano-7-deazaguanine synthase [Gemmata sp.]|jgi:7-cyano-7-deazaguanine synthase|nr:7-cyano-7-deazaguanine synthase [Gemmata sp.]